VPKLSGIVCIHCGKRGNRVVCKGCTSGRPTALRAWLTSSGTQVTDLAAAVGCRRETILRAADGRGMRGAVAVRVSRATGIPLDVLVTGGAK
jgi:hypothetical protein